MRAADLPREAPPVVRTDHSSESEVAKLQYVAVQRTRCCGVEKQHVLPLHIAVHHTALEKVLKSGSQLHHAASGSALVKTFIDPLHQRPALAELKHKETL